MKVRVFQRSAENILKKMIVPVWPALAILLATLVVSIFFTEFTLIAGMNSIWKILLRFLRFLFILVIPIPLLPSLLGFAQHFLSRGNFRLIQIREERDHIPNPWQMWLIRPFQGIGLAMLIATKLIVLVQISTSSARNSSVLLPPAQFTLGRFLSATAIAVMTSLLLSFLWSLDDLNIRQHNRKTGEIRMIGKYVGVLLPILFGFYGIFNLFESHEHL